jgi:hypothetical protein
VFISNVDFWFAIGKYFLRSPLVGFRKILESFQRAPPFACAPEDGLHESKSLQAALVKVGEGLP